MKRIAVLVVLSLFVLTAPALAAGKLHSGWKGAKAGAEKELKAAGLKKLGSYVKFNQDLGPNLDKLETLASKSPQNMTLEQIRKDKNLSKAMLEYTKKSQTTENWLYYTEGYKMKPEKIYPLYIDSGKYQLNLPGSLVKQWKACKDSNQWKPCEKLKKEDTLKEVTGMIINNDLSPFQKQMAANYDTGPLKEKVLKAADDYAKQVGKMDKKADKAKDVLIKELSDIEKAVQKIK